MAVPLAHDIADNARPKTDEFIENVMRPAVQDLIATLEKQADEMSKKVQIASLMNCQMGICSVALVRCFSEHDGVPHLLSATLALTAPANAMPV